MTLEWRTETSTPLSIDTIFQVEQATSSYFFELLNNDAYGELLPNDQKILQTEVVARKQNVAVENVVLETEVSVINVGETGIVDLAEILQLVTVQDTTDLSAFTNLDFIIGLDIELSTVSFNFAIGSELLSQMEPVSSTASAPESDGKYSDNEKVLIIVASVLSFALFALSVILIWIAGGWLALRKQVKILIHREEELTRMTKQQDIGIDQQPTQDTDEEGVGSPGGDATVMTNPSGILGVNPYYGKSGMNRSNPLDGMGIKMTPARTHGGRADSEMFTPMSEATHYTDSGRVPIGITSMRKLIPDDNNDEDDESGLGSFGGFGVKRLEYNMENDD